jgi:hypothetical protein
MRAFTLAVLPLLILSLRLLNLMLWPPPPRLLRWAHAYGSSSTAANVIAAAHAMSTVLDQVG